MNTLQDSAAPAAGHLRPASQPLAIEARRLVKRFGTAEALTGLDLAVPAGTVYGLLGPNGAGKTTAIRILTTLLTPDGGSARVLGHDVVSEAKAVRGRVTLAGQAATVDDDLTGAENLVLLGRLAGLTRQAARARGTALLDAFGLDKAAARQVKTYSGGMRRRLDLAASIIVRAEVYFLDEPTTGLDPASRAQLWQIIRALTADGATVLLTTQYLGEADELAARIAVIDRGRVVAEGTPAELKASVGAGTLRVRLTDPAQRSAAARLLSGLLGVSAPAEADPLLLTVPVSAGQQGRPATERVTAALAALARSGIGIGEFALGQPSLDEVFLALTGGRGTAADGEISSADGAGSSPSIGRKASQ